MDKLVIGVDVGGTNLRAASIDKNGMILRRKSRPSNAKRGIESLIQNLVSVLKEMMEEESISGVGIGIPGVIDVKNGILTQAPNISRVKNYPIREKLEQELGTAIDLALENDANCAALGEWWLGAGKEADSLIIVTLGTGLGGGVILNGSLWRGVSGMAGEIGHMTIDPDGPRCNCGNFGCVESFVSAEAIRRMVKEGLRDKNLKTIVRDQIKHLPVHDIPEIIGKAARVGDRFSREIWEAFGRALGIAIANLTNLLNVEMIIIGGGLSNSIDLFIRPAMIEARKRALRAPLENVEIKNSELGDDAGLLGAGYLALLGR